MDDSKWRGLSVNIKVRVFVAVVGTMIKEEAGVRKPMKSNLDRIIAKGQALMPLIGIKNLHYWPW